MGRLQVHASATNEGSQRYALARVYLDVVHVKAHTVLVTEFATPQECLQKLARCHVQHEKWGGSRPPTTVEAQEDLLGPEYGPLRIFQMGPLELRWIVPAIQHGARSLVFDCFGNELTLEAARELVDRYDLSVLLTWRLSNEARQSAVENGNRYTRDMVPAGILAIADEVTTSISIARGIETETLIDRLKDTRLRPVPETDDRSPPTVWDYISAGD
jgi:hypothetical protein